MFRSVFLKTFYNLRWTVLGWSIAVGFLAFITLALFDAIGQESIEDIIDSMPAAMKAVVGSTAEFNTIPGYIGQQIFGLNVVVLPILMSVIIFIRISAGEEDNGRVQALLGLPVTRTSVFLQKWLAGLLAVALVCLALMSSVFLALMAIDKTADSQRIFFSALDAWLMSAAYGMVAFSVAMITGKKGLTIAVTGVYMVVSLGISWLAPAIDKLAVIDRFSIFHYYNYPQIMQYGVHKKNLLVLVAVIIILAAVGWISFARRDIQS